MGDSNRNKRILILSIVLLAVACIAGVELLACRVADPALYEKIMAPVRACADQAVQMGQAALEKTAQAGQALSTCISETGAAIQAKWEELSARPEPSLEEEPPEATTLLEPETAIPVEILDPSLSDLIFRDGVEYLTGGGVDVAYFNQTDSAWEDTKYGSDHLRTHGCGPTVMSMVVSSLTEEIVDPAEMAQMCVKKGYWAKKHGSYHAIVPGIAEAYGLECTPLPPETLDRDSLYTDLVTGNLIVALVIKGHFTNGGHFILLRGTTLGGEILVADPASRERSLSAWELDLILDELSHTRTSGSPLWKISRPVENPEPSGNGT